MSESTPLRDLLLAPLRDLLKGDEEAIQRLEAVGAREDVPSDVAEVAELLSLLLVRLEGREYLLSLADATESRLRELNELKNQHLAVAAHDLRNPIGTVRGLAKLSTKSLDGDAKSRAYLESIVRISDEMLKLLENLLDVQVIESGRLELDVSWGSLSELTRERGDRIVRYADEKGIRVVQEIRPVPETRFDHSRMGQVLDNLLTNAVKFSPSDTVIELSCEPVGSCIEIRVKDRGVGIPPEELSKIFDAYSRSSVRPTGKEKSTGLGLSTVKPILEGHGGTVEVESTVGVGTTFTIRMPVSERES